MMMMVVMLDGLSTLSTFVNILELKIWNPNINMIGSYCNASAFTLTQLSVFRYDWLQYVWGTQLIPFFNYKQSSTNYWKMVAEVFHPVLWSLWWRDVFRFHINFALNEHNARIPLWTIPLCFRCFRLTIHVTKILLNAKHLRWPANQR